MTKNIMKEAHKMTKEMKKQYPEINYQMQLGLNIQFLVEMSSELNAEKAQRMITNEKEVRQRYNGNNLSTNNKLQGPGLVERTNFKFWSNYGKTRLYYTMTIDGIAVKDTYIDMF